MDVTAEALTEIHLDAMNYLDGLAADARLLVGAQYRTIAEIVGDAPREAALWVGPDPSSDPGWEPPRDMTRARWRRERAEFAQRAAVADVAVRLHLSENTVRSRVAVAETLQERCPTVWRHFLGGSVAEQIAITAAHYADSLPADVPEAWAAYDAAIASAATRLTPGRFRTRARVVRERVHAYSIDERHTRAASDRGVWVAPECDGMATLTAVLPAVDAHAIVERLDTAARHLRTGAGEQRTLDHLRADVLADLLIQGVTVLVDASMQASVAITVPVLTLLGASEQPAVLDGYGPIDLDTANKIAGTARSWTRVLTDPVSGTVLDVDRSTYRPPADLRRWVERMHPTCAFPGCGRSSRACDLDHKQAWSAGGATAAPNLHPLCEPHHRVRHNTAWEILPGIADPARRTRWRSPTGALSTSDPPPF